MTHQYAHPPVSRVVLSFERSESVEWSAHQIESLRSSLGPEWRGGKIIQTADGWELFHSLGDRLIQLGPRSFGFGWDGASGFGYPTYETIRDGFLEWLGRLQKMVGERFKTPPCIKGWHIAYVNRIPQGTVWETVDDLSAFRPLAAFSWGYAGGRVQSGTGNWNLVAPDEIDFQVSWQLETNSTPDRSVLVVTLAASKSIKQFEPGEASEIDALLDGLDAGRKLIVTTFPLLFTRAASQWWGA